MDNRGTFPQVSAALLAGVLVLLLWTSLAQPVDWGETWLPILLFSVAFALPSDLVSSLFTSGPALSPGYTHQTHAVALAAMLALGLAPALWIVLLGTALIETLRRFLNARVLAMHSFSPQSYKTWPVIAAETGVGGISLFVAGVIYRGVGGSFATAEWVWRDLLAMVTLFGIHFLTRNALDAWLVRVRGASISDHFQRHLGQILSLQLLPLPFAVLAAWVYLRLGTVTAIALGGLLIGFWILSLRLLEMRQDLESRLRELHTLNQVGQALSTSLELDVLLNTIYHQVCRLMEADNFYIALYDAVTDELAFPVVFQDGKRRRYASRRAGNGLTEYVIHQRRPLLIREDTAQIIDALDLEVIGEPALSWLGVPLSAGEKVLGVLAVQSFANANAYDQEDLELLSTLATQAAIVLENAQLYGQMRRRTAELALLNTVSTAVSSTLDLGQVLQIIVTSVMPIMVCQKSALYLLKDADGKPRLAASEGFSDTFKQDAARSYDQFDRVRERSLVVVPDIADNPLPAAQIELALQENYRAFAHVLLVAQNEPVGILGVYYDQIHHFDLAERDLLSTFANQAATAIANARIYRRTDQALARRVDELSAIAEIGRELISRLEPERVLDRVLEQALNATGATRGCIAMPDENQPLINVVTQRGYETEAARDFLSKPHARDQGVVGHVLNSGQLALIPDVQQEPDYLLIDPSVQSQLTVPILHEAKVLGAINLESDRMGGFEEQDANFVSHLATQAAVALKNAQLFQERSQRVEEMSLLYQASLALASSLDYREVLDTISRLARHITNSDAVTLYLYDAATDTFERVSSQGYRAEETRPSTIRSKGMSYSIVRTGQPTMVLDTLTYPDINPIVIKRGIRSLIGVPVMSRGHVLGVLFVNQRKPHAYTENDLQMVSALATQAGATIANVRLFAQISKARDRLEAIINSIQDGILVLDNLGRVVIANARIEFFAGLRRDQLEGRIMDALIQDRREAFMDMLGLTSDGLDQWVHSLRMDSSASFTRTFEISGAGTVSEQARAKPRFVDFFSIPVLDETHQIISRLLVFRDITEQKELEEMREDLTGMIIHDLRSPLTAILSGLEMIKELVIDEDSDPLAVHAMQIASRSCHTMLTLVNSLLDISHLESGQMPLERAPAPFAPLVRGAIARLSPLAADHNVTLHAELPPNLPMAEVDNEKIGRVLINLLDNALKFSPEGSQVTLRAVSQDGEAGEVLLCSVSDQGPGIPKEYRDRIFDRFAQVRDRQAPRGAKGTGLGLAFCKLAVEAHGGQIWVESEPDQGSTFYFTLPVADIDAWLGHGLHQED